MEKIDTPAAPAAVGPYSQAIRTGNLLWISGQLPLDPATGAIAGETAAEQTARCLSNIDAIARAAGACLGQVVKTTVLLTDLSEFTAVNNIYAAVMSEPYPARACYQVAALPKGAKVEIEAVVALDAIVR